MTDTEPPTARCVTCEAISPDRADYQAVADWAQRHLAINRKHTVEVTRVSVSVAHEGRGAWLSGAQFRTTTLVGADA